ncbi:efflux RND transporter permease subunit [Rhodohalobacter sp.]|uniref:efflux RND transporter permease subunit n=1 Tax=Rhodohalobacter sp. TaxID=1974210 RepID=UPI002ACE9F24|nr:efflux RND transporter permease subunit [Rhodohalobacter sp.]MDZ7756407.1 efflux RND transporter permease subunit [Rhodohalobacter sp.]
MSLSSLSIRRPVLATVMSLVILILGIVAFTFLGIREYPATEPPIVTVSTSYTGANAEIIESQITEPLEEEVNGIAGIRTITSTSREGRSTITVEFELEIDLNDAANDVQSRVSRAVRNLPPDADPPVVSKADADSSPIVFLNVRSDKRSLLDLSDVAFNDFKERVQTIPGVSSVQIWGEKEYSMRLWLDPLRLAAYRLTPLDVQQALQRENVELPSGRIEGNLTELTVRTQGRLYEPEEFNNLIIAESDGNVIRFKDIGNAELGAANERTILKRNGIPMVGVVIVPQPGANQIEIADEFYKRVDQIKTDLPEDIQTAVGFDTTEYVRASIDEVQQTIFLALGLVVLIIFLFLRDFRTTVIPIIVIPIALIGAFFIMYIAGFSINVLTLLAIVLAIGLVVDDAIVVLENIYAKIENGMDVIEAGILGSQEIFFAVVATSLALVSVFTPILFLGGLTGRLFLEFGVVMAGAIVISSFVALTLTPMLSTKFLKSDAQHSWFYKKTEPFFIKLNEVYKSSLESFMEKRWMALVITVLCIGGIWVFLNNLQQELAPLEDRGRLIVSSTAPEGATFDYMDRYMNQLTDFLLEEVPETEGLITVTSPGFGSSGSVNSGFGRLILTDASERERSQQEIYNDLSTKIQDLSGARTFVAQEQSIGGGRGGQPVQYVLQANTIDKLKEVIPEFMEKASQDPTFAFVDVNLKFSKPEVEITIDRDRAQALGVSTRDIAETLQLAYSGQRFGFFLKNGKQYQVIGQMSRKDRNAPIDLKSLYVRNDEGDIIQMDNLVTLRETSSPPQLYRFNRYASATVSASLAPGKTIGDGIEAMDAIADEVLDASFTTSLSGPSRDFVESSSSLIYVFLLALILVYLVLSAQFESFRDPLVIMFTVPLALTGALLTLWYFNQTLNIFSQIGMIMLIGLVTKNGILIVEFANQRQVQGLSNLEAIKEAAVARFRPILMTSLSTVLGILPIALALGAGAESRKSMGIAIIGGLIFASILTLYVIPALYSYISAERSEKGAIDDEKLKKIDNMEPAQV